jgi:hypothetical protein
MGVSTNGFRELLDELPNQGWTVSRTDSTHWKAVPPDTSLSIVHFSGEVTDGKVFRNIISNLRRQGFEWPPVTKKVQRSMREDQEGSMNKVRSTTTTREYEVDQSGVVSSRPPAVTPAVPQDRSPLGHRIVAEPTREAPQSAPDLRVVTPSLQERTMDEAFRALKDARSYDALAGEHVSECQGVFDEAQRKLNAAHEEKKRAATALHAARSLFEKVFEAQ